MANRSQSKSKRPNRRDSERTQREILEAATIEFARWGYGGARIAQITKRAKANDRSLYYYFSSKKNLFRVVLETTYLRLAEAEIALNLESAAPREAIKKLVEFTWEFHASHPEFISILNTENLHRGEHIRSSLTTTRHSTTQLNIIREILDRGVALGQFRAGADPTHILLTMSGLSFFYLSNQYTLSAYLGTNTMAVNRKRKWVEYILELILSYLTADRPIETAKLSSRE